MRTFLSDFTRHTQVVPDQPLYSPLIDSLAAFSQKQSVSCIPVRLFTKQLWACFKVADERIKCGGADRYNSLLAAFADHLDLFCSEPYVVYIQCNQFTQSHACRVEQLHDCSILQRYRILAICQFKHLFNICSCSCFCQSRLLCRNNKQVGWILLDISTSECIFTKCTYRSHLSGNT